MAKFLIKVSYSKAGIAGVRKEGATPRDGDENFRLLHPKNTMISLETMKKNNTLERALQPDPARAYVD